MKATYGTWIIYTEGRSQDTERVCCVQILTTKVRADLQMTLIV